MPQNSTPPTRKTILTAVGNLIVGINGQAPYLTEVDNVYTYDIAASDGLADDIGVGVFSRTFQIQATKTRLTRGADCPAILIVGIRAVIRGGADTVSDVKDNLIADLQTAFFQDISLGVLPNNNAVKIDNLSFEQEGISASGTGGLAMFLASLTVSFLTDPAHP